MAESFLKWIADHKDALGLLGTAAAGAFALLKWFSGKSTETSQKKTKIPTDIKIGLVGASEGAHIPSQHRRYTSPTANEIRLKEESVSQSTSLYLKEDQIKKLWSSYLGQKVAWPIRLYGFRKVGESSTESPEDIWSVASRYGEESWGACIEFRVKIGDHPALKSVDVGRRAFIEGEIVRITTGDITLAISSLELE